MNSAPNLDGMTAVGGDDGALEEGSFGTGSKQNDICNFLGRRFSRHGHAVDCDSVVGDVCGEWCAGTVSMWTAYLLGIAYSTIPGATQLTRILNGEHCKHY